MQTVSVKLTFTDDSWYDWFIEPRKVNNELPNLILRLLRAYSDNDELAMQIDQFLDKEVEPEIFDTRAAIAEALGRLNTLNSTLTQDIETLGAESGEPTLSDDDDDVIVTDADGQNLAYTPESVASDLSNLMGIDDNEDSIDLFSTSDIATSTPSVQTPVSQPTQVAPSAPNDSTQIDKILEALGMMTGQITQLTQTVSTLATINVNNATGATQVQPLQTVPATEPVQSATQEATSSQDTSNSAEYDVPDFMDDVLASLDL